MSTLADIGELQLLEKVLLPCVTSLADGLGDDCARIEQTKRRLLWSIDPCPTPVAQWLGVCTPRVLGWYTALINLSDIAACGGRPIGMLVSLEMPDDTPVSFVESFYEGLLAALEAHQSLLLGGNVKSAARFSATGTIVGEEGAHAVGRITGSEDCFAYLVGDCGSFWASVLGHQRGWGAASKIEADRLRDALLFPRPQVAAGSILAELPFQIACMDCSDGPANALFQLARSNNLELVVPDRPDWAIPTEACNLLGLHQIPLENACYHFGDWQLACLVPIDQRKSFEERMRGIPLTWMGRARKGFGGVVTEGGRQLLPESLNQNFRSGYNSMKSADGLIERFMNQPVFSKAPK
ncbi:Thiamine-monophosphate kinase [Cupriavidus necator H850]|uniref:thiamine-phosphate kinase n=1 Tax=Cupriavidus necator TaxID=106590 RepID=UPI00189296C5|nr:AIR synthase related protein [Cupriavidus necator]KAI3608387.1 Thiamine-monophosphate kinase [Cupriavidus necator H850]